MKMSVSPRTKAMLAAAARRALRSGSLVAGGLVILSVGLISAGAMFATLALTAEALSFPFGGPLALSYPGWVDPARVWVCGAAILAVAGWAAYDLRRSPGMWRPLAWRRPVLSLMWVLSSGLALLLDRIGQMDGYLPCYGAMPLAVIQKGGRDPAEGGGAPWRNAIEPALSSARWARAWLSLLPQVCPIMTWGLISAALSAVLAPLVVLEMCVIGALSWLASWLSTPMRSRMSAYAQGLVDEGAPELAKAEAAALRGKGAPANPGCSKKTL